MSFFRTVSFAAACLLAFGFVASGQSAITYNGTDIATQGAWGGVYGGDGYILAPTINTNMTGGTGYAQVNLSSASSYTWVSTLTRGPNYNANAALQTSAGSSTGTAAQWYGSTFQINVSLSDGKAHQIALYLLDWDTNSRAETITVAGATVSNSQSFSSFQSGKWAVWTVTGNVSIQVTSTTSNNATVSGIFFGPAAGGSTGGGGGAAQASFGSPDTTTAGAWMGTYGNDGYIIANSIYAPPAYATVTPTASSPLYTPSGALLYTWAAQISRTPLYLGALQLPASPGNGIASSFYGNSFNIGVNLTDGNTHQIALYLLDWDTSSRAETISVLDANSQSVLASANFSNFHSGTWAVLTVSGNVTIQVTNQNSFGNATISGIFFGTAQATTPTPKTQTITFGSISTQTVGTPLTLTATASSGLAVTYTSTTPAVCTVSGSTASFAGAGSCTITAAQGGNSNYSAAASVSETFSVANAGGGGSGGLSFRHDTSTQGTWIGNYGKDGYLMAPSTSNPGASSPPGYASVSITGDSTYTWAWQTSDIRALQIPSSPSSRAASSFYANPGFTINVNITDGKSHQVALYLLDWDTTTRNETISVVAANGVDTESFTSFNGGQWGVWNVSGNVTINVTNNAGSSNATISGIFFDPVSGATPQQQQPQSITFGSIPAQAVGGSLALAATASSGLGVTYSASPGAVCTVSGSTATFVSAGSCSVTASQGGNGSYLAAAPVTETFTVNAAATGSYQISGYVLLGGTGPSANTGVPNVTLTLSNGQSAVSGANGFYSFTVGSPGTYKISASYSGSIYTLSAPQTVTTNASTSYPNQNFTATFTSGGSLSPSSPNKEYIFLNGAVIAVEHPH